ncbi:hypothetical protein [Vibrio sp. WXL103]|uniref:hypothetical protein n=1 Tax=unclassified Vibrio TaxID=2614977 RepID=UPI003EC85DD2
MEIIYGLFESSSPTSIIDVRHQLRFITHHSILPIVQSKVLEVDKATKRVAFAALAHDDESPELNQWIETSRGQVKFTRKRRPILMKKLPPLPITASLTARRRRFRKENNRVMTEKNWKQFIIRKHAPEVSTS